MLLDYYWIIDINNSDSPTLNSCLMMHLKDRFTRE